MRALVVTNMWPSPARPARGAFVRDQVTALRALPGVTVDVFAFDPDGPLGYAKAALALRRAHAHGGHDVVHAHFGLSAWVALALGRTAPRVLTVHGTDVRHRVTGPLTRVVARRQDLVAAVSAELGAELGPGPARTAVLPCGVDLGRFRPLDRAACRTTLGLDPDAPLLLFPADPARAGKRHDLALEAAGEVRLATLGAVAPEEVPTWVNAANAVVLPSDAEGFGLAVLEALACDVPVLATPVGVHALALDGIAGTHCAPWDRDAWRAALAPHLAAADPRVEGRGRAALFGSGPMAERVLAAWRELADALVPSSVEAPQGAAAA